MNMMEGGWEVEDAEYVEKRGCLLMNKSLKSTMIRNIRRIKRFARVHISPYSPGMEQAIFYGDRNQIADAIKEFISRFTN